MPPTSLSAFFFISSYESEQSFWYRSNFSDGFSSDCPNFRLGFTIRRWSYRRNQNRFGKSFLFKTSSNLRFQSAFRNVSIFYLFISSFYHFIFFFEDLDIINGEIRKNRRRFWQNYAKMRNWTVRILNLEKCESERGRLLDPLNWRTRTVRIVFPTRIGG